MKVESATFFCDTPQCASLVTVLESHTSTAAYLALVEAGWNVDRPLVAGRWKHHCPDHLGPKGEPARPTPEGGPR